jgi:hypothetical protein
MGDKPTPRILLKAKRILPGWPSTEKNLKILFDPHVT